jgi:polyhydroxybutyrate depolymerase
VLNGGHTWPGGWQYSAGAIIVSQQADASRLMMDDLWIDIVEEKAAASLVGLGGGKGSLTVSVAKTYGNGKQDAVQETYVIDENADGLYAVDDYSVYVATEGNTVRKCSIVDSGALGALGDFEFEGGLKIGERAKGYLEYQGIKRMFEYYVPASHTGKRMPLMLTLPGSGHNSTMQLDEISGFERVAEDKGFIVVAANAVAWLPEDYHLWVDDAGNEIYADRFMPSTDGSAGPYTYAVDGVQGSYVNGSAGYTSNSTRPITKPGTAEKSVSNWIQEVTLGTERVSKVGVDDEGYFCALAESFIEQGLADGNRVFVSGLSQGGFMSARLVALHGDIFKGAGVVSGELTKAVIDKAAAAAPAASPVKLVYFHGDRDSVVPAGEMLPDRSFSPGGTHYWNTITGGNSWMTLNETIAWFLGREGLAMAVTGETQLPHKDVYVSDYGSDAEYLDPTSITRYEYGGGAAVLYWVKEGGHAWPGGTQYAALATVGQLSMQADASALMMDDLWIELADETPSAYVRELPGDKNELTVSLAKVYGNGGEDVVSATFMIGKNADGVYRVDDYDIYVNTENAQVNACYIAAAATHAKAHTSSRVSLRLKQTLALSFDIDSAGYEFVSSNPTIARVDKYGTVTPVRAGVALVTLRATDGSGLTSSVMLSVTP